jgi:hypothetical protein
VAKVKKWEMGKRRGKGEKDTVDEGKEKDRRDEGKGRKTSSGGKEAGK